MKKVFLILCIVLLVVGCSKKINKNAIDKETDINMEILNKVLNDKEMFINEKGNKVFLKNYIIAEGISLDSILAEPSEYAFVDFDEDGKEELVINVSENYGYYIVLHYNGENVYSYEFGIRALSSLKTDGSFIGSNGAASNYYCRLSFEDNVKNIKYEAIKDSTLGVFELNGNDTSIEELNEFINDWNLKANVKWIKINKKEELNDSFENKPVNQETKKININKYLKVKYSGYNHAGYATVSLDKEQFYLDNISIIKFKDENAQKAYYNLTKSKDAPIDIFFNYINKMKMSKSSYLKNDDVILIEWNIDREQISKYFSVDFSYSDEKRMVNGLTNPEKFNPMDYISVDYTNGFIQIKSDTSHILDRELSKKIDNALYEKNFSYDISTISNKNHTIVVKYNVVNLNDEKSISSFIANYGLIPTENQGTYKINNYRYKINNISEINNSFWKKATEDCKNRLATYSEQIAVNNLKALEAYYSYLDNDLVIVFQVDATANYIEWIDGSPTQNTISEDVTYYYLSTYRDLIYNQNDELTFSSKSYHHNGEMFRKTLSKNQKYYTFDIDGVGTINDAKDLISGNLLDSDARGIEYYKFN